MRVAYFTAGTVGAGHLVRGLAIGRALARAGLGDSMRMFSAPSDFDHLVPGGLRSVRVDREELGDPARAPQSDVARALRSFEPEVLLVDMFWAPLRFILPLPGTEAWLLLRLAPSMWLRGPPGVPFAPRLFRRILGIEPGLPFDVEAIDPIVGCEREDLLGRAEARARLGARRDGPLTLVVHAGLAGEIDGLRARAAEIAPGSEVVVCDLHRPGARFPLAPLMSGADLIVGGAGYNLFWETRRLGLASRAHLVPLARPIDLQARRVAVGKSSPTARNGADTLVAFLRGR